MRFGRAFSVVQGGGASARVLSFAFICRVRNQVSGIPLSEYGKGFIKTELLDETVTSQIST